MAQSTASERFFAISELVSLMLHEVDTITLIHCQRVCRTLTDMIRQSQTLQENIFIQPLRNVASEDGTSQLQKPVTLNPVARTYFGTLLLNDTTVGLPNGASIIQTGTCTYADLTSLPWARDGARMDAPSRLAFARPEASWRNMLFTNPPLQQMDWRHRWDTAKCDTEDDATGSTDPSMSGDGHGRDYDRVVTLGMLWDIIEGRLVRGCSCRLTVFLSGCPIADDPVASSSVKSWSRLAPGSRRGFVATAPRIRLDTHQHWIVTPSMYQYFDVRQGSWQVEDELPWTLSTEEERQKYKDWDGNGLIWLNEDCKRDGEASNRRWSRSDDCGDNSLNLRNGGGSRLSHEAMLRRWATMDRVRSRMGHATLSRTTRS